MDRYGSRIDGLWIDENQIAGDQDSLVDYKRLLKTIRQRNPDIVTMQNGGQIYTTDMGGPECVGNWNFGWSECMYNLLNPGGGPDAGGHGAHDGAGSGGEFRGRRSALEH